MVEAEWQRRLAGALLRICAGYIGFGIYDIWGFEMSDPTSHATLAQGSLQLLAAEIRRGRATTKDERNSLRMARAWADAMLRAQSLSPADIYHAAIQWDMDPSEKYLNASRGM